MLILQARVAAGWIDASELPQPEPEYEEEYAEGEYDPDVVFGGGDAEAGEAEAPEGADDQPQDA
jgi:N utilization substance protein A